MMESPKRHRIETEVRFRTSDFGLEQWLFSMGHATQDDQFAALRKSLAEV